MARCRSDKHRQCGSYRNSRVGDCKRPTRLLYVDAKRPSHIRLVELDESRGYGYVTLNHRWGLPPDGPPKLSRRQTALEEAGRVWMQDLKEGILISKLPRTFREAFQLVQYCGLEYLWIDSLCIVQDKDEDDINPDWSDEAAKMGDIYAGGLW